MQSEGKSGLKYYPRLIQSLFLRTVETGLRDESIRIKLRTFLRDENISDEKRLLELNIAACEKAERQAKFTPPPPQKKTPPKKQQVSSKISRTASSEFSHNSKKERKQENDLAAAVQLLQANVATLTRAVNDLK